MNIKENKCSFNEGSYYTNEIRLLKAEEEIRRNNRPNGCKVRI